MLASMKFQDRKSKDLERQADPQKARKDANELTKEPSKGTGARPSVFFGGTHIWLVQVRRLGVYYEFAHLSQDLRNFAVACHTKAHTLPSH